MILTVTLNPCVDKTIFVQKDERGEIIQATGVKQIAGGKGVNVSRTVKTMGITSRALVVVGGHYGELIVDLARSEGIDLLPVRISNSSRTVVTILEEPTGISTAYVEPGPKVLPEERQSIVNAFAGVLPEVEFVVLSGSVPCQELDDIYLEMLELCRKRDVPALLDTRGEALRLGLLGRPDFVKPNAAEAENLLGRRIASEHDAIEALLAIRDLGAGSVILSLGRSGAIAISPEETGSTIWRLRAPKVKTINPVGSGDSMVGAIVSQLYRNRPFEEALRYGGAAGAANASIWDAASCGIEQIESLLEDSRVEVVNQSVEGGK